MYRPISILASRDRSSAIWQPSHRQRLEPVASATPESVFCQVCDVMVLYAAEQIALSMTGDSTIFNLRRPFSDSDGIDDLTSGLFVSPRVQ